MAAWRVRALTADMQARYTSNSLTAGFWKVAPAALGGGSFRLMNNTITCDGPWLVVYEGEPPENVTWGELPASWEKDGVVQMALAKGTLVPAVTLVQSTARRIALGSKKANDALQKRKRSGSTGRSREQPAATVTAASSEGARAGRGQRGWARGDTPGAG